ncbi:MAG: hypothetical protein HY226_01070 [Candidatus Vogelbacteria bacterium]|nr:hypothetical protein [Candidatus Vogelbacteria bacterium]
MNLRKLQRYLEEYAKYISIMLMSFVVTLSVLYIYFINLSVLDTMTRQQNDRLISVASSDIGILENDYINLRDSLNLGVAKTMGFNDDFSKIHFSSENSNVAGSISLRGNEI